MQIKSEALTEFQNYILKSYFANWKFPSYTHHLLNDDTQLLRHYIDWDSFIRHIKPFLNNGDKILEFLEINANYLKAKLSHQGLKLLLADKCNLLSADQIKLIKRNYRDVFITLGLNEIFSLKKSNPQSLRKMKFEDSKTLAQNNHSFFSYKTQLMTFTAACIGICMLTMKYR